MRSGGNSFNNAYFPDNQLINLAHLVQFNRL